ncbi:MAG: RsmD family RNA methyltransferase [Acidimicrobiales bacterium]
MRVVAGSSRGRSIRAPSGIAIRPTSDKVREAIFDVLTAFVDLEGATVADLFAGTGAMGIEALSRGAGSVVFVDSSALAMEAVKANLRSTGLDGASARLVRSDVLEWLGQGAARDPSASGAFEGPWDLALVDPPYAFAAWERLLGVLPAKVAVLESDRPIQDTEAFDVVRTKRYGGTLVTVVRAAGAIRR